MNCFKPLSPQDTGTVLIIVDGQSLVARAGEPLATALLTNGILKMRNSPNQQTPRGAFCLMGVCQECAVYVDNMLQQACMTPVREGMVVELRGVP